MRKFNPESKESTGLKQSGIKFSKLFAYLRVRNVQKWLSVALTFIALLIPVLSIEQAHWVDPQPSFVLTLALAILATALMFALRLWNKVVYALIFVLGLVVMIWQSSGLATKTVGEPGLNAWWRTVTGGLPSENSIYFAMFLILITWLIGAISAWFILKKHNAWAAVFLGTVMALVNLNNLPVEYYYFMPMFFASALILIFQVNISNQTNNSKNQIIQKAPRNGFQMVVAVFVVIAVVVSTAWFTPEPPVTQMGLKLDTTGFHDVNPTQNWFNIFAGIPSKFPWMESKKQAKLLFESPLESGESVHFIVTSDTPAYWITRRYDTYNSWGWTSNPTADEAISVGTSVGGELPPLSANAVNYTVENRIKTDVIITTGEFVRADIPILLKTVPIERIDAGIKSDVIVVASPWVLGPYQRYTAMDNIPSFSAEDLVAVKGNYPDWVTQRYLQLPDSFPRFIRSMSVNLTMYAPTPYQKLVEIKKYLNRLHYDQKSAILSGTQDGVSSFLFNTQKGNCLSFASSMVVMLRSVGIPSRLCTGYLRGDLDTKTGKYIIKSRHYHAWAEVYFPGYGWIEFETTPDTTPDEEVELIGDNAAFTFTDELPPWMEEEELPGSNAGISGGTTTVSPTSTLPIYLIVFGVIVLILISVRTVFGMWIGQMKHVKNPFEAYSRMCYLASFTKAGPLAQETPLEYSGRLAAILPWQNEYIVNIARSYSNIRYSPRKEMEEFEKTTLQKSWTEVCSSLIKRRLQSKKWFLLRIIGRLE